jgi:hypothetical protein
MSWSETVRVVAGAEGSGFNGRVGCGFRLSII